MSYYLKLSKINNAVVFQYCDHQYQLDILVGNQHIPNQKKVMILTQDNGRKRSICTILDPFWPNFRLGNTVKNYANLGFALAACRYIRNAPIFCDPRFLRIWTRYNGMPRNLGFVHNGMPVNAGE